MRRALALEAEKNGLAQNPRVAAALRLAKDRILSDAFVTEMDANLKPTDEALDSMQAVPIRYNYLGLCNKKR